MFQSEEYLTITVQQSFKILRDMVVLGVDTETLGFDPYTKPILSLQMGNGVDQVMVDCKTVDPREYKEILEDPERLLLLVNAKFDLKFLYHYRIIPKRIYDVYLAEKILYLGYPPGMHGMGLADCARRYCSVELDKTVRGNIMWEGLTERVIIYGCDDVKYLPSIREEQLKLLSQKDLLRSLELENEFVKCLAYIEYCGVKLDVNKWKAKMKADQKKLEDSLKALNEWVVNYGNEKYIYRDLQGDLFEGFKGPQCNINWNSGKQVIPLFEELGFNLNTFDKELGKMKKSVDASIIKPQVHISDIAPIYLEYTGAQKVVSTYGQNFLDAINPVSGRIHTQFNQLMDTGRLSCGGKNKDTKESYLNLQNLPRDSETRACFVADKGNLWASADYKGQESVIIANVTGDPEMIREFTEGIGDIHSLVAKMAYPDIIGDTPVAEIAAKHKKIRNEAKKVEFAINYGGDANTIMSNNGIPMKEAQKIYDNYMSGFVGMQRYQDYCRRDVMEKGYILLNPKIRNKAYIYDYDRLSVAKSKFTGEFWQMYNIYKQSRETIETISKHDKQFIWDEFTTTDKTVEEISDEIGISEYTIYATLVKYFFRRKSASEKQSINYRIQGTGALCFKLASIKFFNWLVKNDLLFTVKYCIPVHDELNIEYPEEMADVLPDMLVKCMVSAGDYFCDPVKLGVDVEVGDHWIH